MTALRCALLSVLTVGCFSDSGVALTQSATSVDPGSSSGSGATVTATTSGATTVEPTSTSAPDPTTTTATTATITTAVDPTTGAPTCPVDTCQPGDIDDFGPCKPCGHLLATCQDDCTWSAPECVFDLSSCAYWSHELGAREWTRHALPQPLPVHAPSQPVAAAFELPTDQRIVALTQTSYHVLTPADGAWIASGSLTAMLPGFPGPVLHAYTVYNADAQSYDLTVTYGEQVYIYTLPSGSLTATFVQEAPCCGSWSDTVNPGDITSVRDFYLDLDDLTGWSPATAQHPECNNNVLFALSSHGAWITPTTVYVQEIGTCFKLVAQQPYTSHGAFGLDSAPPGDLVGGAALFGKTFYVFAGD